MSILAERYIHGDVELDAWVRVDESDWRIIIKANCAENFNFSNMSVTPDTKTRICGSEDNQLSMFALVV